ncbi:hypothetical protein HGRIS_003288 [Hohenbuehelia grisea]|uniref:PRA1 family protein n=1 Tax=Hohenbuehelia grisea TaxID=104357 RepID=A0ABR3JN84_9AGAR
MERIDSGTTIDSPFASNLNTPVDGPSISPFEDVFKDSGGSIKQRRPTVPSPSVSIAQSQDFADAIQLIHRSSTRGFLISTPTAPRRQKPALLPEIDGESLSDYPNERVQPPDDNEHKEDKLPLDTVPQLGVSNAAILESFVDALSFPQGPPSFTESAILNIIKAACFLPWWASVGACILLAPDHLELVAFSPGYLPSPQGIHRFAYWTNYAAAHVLLFLACLLIAIWCNPLPGLLVAAATLAGFVVAWRDFEYNLGTPLGDDDLQALYVLATTYVKGKELPDMLKMPLGQFIISGSLDGYDVSDAD